MSTERFGVEVFPSLVESALAFREPKWRELEAALERLEEARHTGGVKSSFDEAKRQKAMELRASGMGIGRIAAALHVREQTVREFFRAVCREAPSPGTDASQEAA